MICSLRLAAFALLLAFAAGARAQSVDALPAVTRTYAIVDARIVQAPGREIPRGTVLVRDGLIAGVGTDIVVPFDAERIAGDSLVVYAGFIDGLSHAGIPEPKREDDPAPVSRANPPDDRAGIQPQRFAYAMIDPKDTSIADLRNAGFGAAHVVPHGQMLPGSGTVILLAGDTAPSMVLVPEASLFFQFDGGRRVYPATPMGVMAKFRQLYREAERRHAVASQYDDNPRGLARPTYDPVHYAFFPVIEGQKPVFIYTDDALEIHRAFRLRGDLGFPIALAGLYQTFDALDALAAQNAPLFLTLKLPKEAPKKAAADSTGSPAFDPNFRTASFADAAAEKQNLTVRQEIFRQQYVGTAAALHEAGLGFGFSAKGVKPADIHPNLRRMVEAGLPEDAALAALTTNPAQSLGLSESLGTIEVGKIANLAVADGPLFDKKTALRYVFVDGRKFAVERPKPPARSDSTAGENPVGVWAFTVASQGVAGVLTLTGTPDDLDGTIEAEGQTLRTLESVELEGRRLTFVFYVEDSGRFTADLTIDGDVLSGTFESTSTGSLTVAGSRRAPGSGRP
jgi:imidazolonepropionase-like amidohydrolase